MARRLHPRCLKSCLEWLKRHRPGSASAYGLTVSNVRGLERDEYWVDRWPEPSTLLIRTPHIVGEPYRDFENNMCVYTTDGDKCYNLLAKPGLVDWKQPFMFSGVPRMAFEAIDAICKEKQVRPQVDDVRLIQFVPGRTPMPIAPGFDLGPLQPEDAPLLASKWTYQSPHKAEFIAHFIKTYPSAGLRDKNGALAAWTLTYRTWMAGITYVLPEYRRLGLGAALQYVFNPLLREHGMDQLGTVMAENEASIRMFKRSGYDFVENGELYDIYISREEHLEEVAKL